MRSHPCSEHLLIATHVMHCFAVHFFTRFATHTPARGLSPQNRLQYRALHGCTAALEW